MYDDDDGDDDGDLSNYVRIMILLNTWCHKPSDLEISVVNLSGVGGLFIVTPSRL